MKRTRIGREIKHQQSMYTKYYYKYCTVVKAYQFSVQQSVLAYVHPYSWRERMTMSGLRRRHKLDLKQPPSIPTGLPGVFLIHRLRVDKRRRCTILSGKSLSTLKGWISSAGKIIEIANIIAHFKPYITRSLYNLLQFVLF